MRVLGIDPGSRHTGYGIVDAIGSKTTLVTQGRFSCRSQDALPLRLAYLADETRTLVQRWTPTVAVLEKPFQGVNPRSLIVLAQARGALLTTIAQLGLDIAEYAPAEVKIAVAGNGRADKAQIQRMVSILLAIRETPLTPDAADALAVALCYTARRPWQTATKTRSK